MPPHPTYRRPILILFFYIHLGHPSGPIPSGFPTITCTHLSSLPHLLHALPLSVTVIVVVRKNPDLGIVEKSIILKNGNLTKIFPRKRKQHVLLAESLFLINFLFLLFLCEINNDHLFEIISRLFPTCDVTLQLGLGPLRFLGFSCGF